MTPVVMQSRHMINDVCPISQNGINIGQEEAKQIPNNASEKQLNSLDETKENKLILNKLLSEHKGKYSKIPVSPKEILSEDKASVQGQFGWTQFDSIFIPYLMRSEEKYVSVDMMQSKIFFKYQKYFSRELYACGLIEKFHMSSTEASLLNEINLAHCDNYFGKKLYSPKDYIIKLICAKRMYEFLNFCYKKLVEKDTNVEKQCGFIKIDNSCVPYIWYKDKQCVPVFFFEGQSTYLEHQALQLKGFELTYLKLLCKIQGLKKEFFDVGSVPVVDVEMIKTLFKPGTLFQDCWPIDYCIKLLLNNTTENNNSQINFQSAQEPQNQNPHTDEQLPQQTLKATHQLPQMLDLSMQTSKMKTKQYLGSTTYKPYSTKIVSVTENLLTSQNNTPVSEYTKKSTDINMMSTQTTTFVNSGHQVPQERDQNSLEDIIINIPDYPPSNQVYYFLIRSQIEDIVLHHCINIDPFRKHEVIVTLEEVSDVFKIPLDTLINIIRDLEISIYRPNKEQLRLFSAYQRSTTKGVINVQHLTNNLQKIRSSLLNNTHMS